MDSGFLISLSALFGVYALLIFGFVFYPIRKSVKTNTQYSKIKSKSGLTGKQIAVKLLSFYRIGDILIEEVPPSERSAVYDYKRQVLQLFSNIYNESDLHALAFSAFKSAYVIEWQRLSGLISKDSGYRFLFIVAKSFAILLILATGSLVLAFKKSLYLYPAIAALFLLIWSPFGFYLIRRAVYFLKESKLADETEIIAVNKILKDNIYTLNLIDMRYLYPLNPMHHIAKHIEEDLQQ